MFIRTFATTVEDTWLSNLDDIVEQVAKEGQVRVGFALKHSGQGADHARELLQSRLEPMEPAIKVEILRTVPVSEKVSDLWFDISRIG